MCSSDLLGRKLDEALGRVGRREIVRDVKGKRENTPIDIRPRSRNNEATPSIQRMTHGEVGTTKRRRPSSE